MFSHAVVLSCEWWYLNASVHLRTCKLLARKSFPCLQGTPVYRSPFQWHMVSELCNTQSLLKIEKQVPCNLGNRITEGEKKPCPQEGVFGIWINCLSRLKSFARNHRIIGCFGLEGTIRGHLAQHPRSGLRAGTSSTRPACSEPRPTWLWMFLGMGSPLPLWTTCSSASPSSW